MIRYRCPNCAIELEVPVSQGGQEIHCSNCGTRTTVPTPAAPEARQLPRPVTVPILVSAIANAVFAYLWAATCLGIVLAVPLVILCIFEFIFYSQAQQWPLEKVARRATTLAILEILELLLFNVVSVICGIVVLVHVGQLKTPQGSVPATAAASVELTGKAGSDGINSPAKENHG